MLVGGRVAFSFNVDCHREIAWTIFRASCGIWDGYAEEELLWVAMAHLVHDVYPSIEAGKGFGRLSRF